MRVVGADHILRLLGLVDASAAGLIRAWWADVSHADWQTAEDIERIYPNVTGSACRFVFVLADGAIQITTLITFDAQIVLVIEAIPTPTASAGQRRRS